MKVQLKFLICSLPMITSFAYLREKTNFANALTMLQFFEGISGLCIHLSKSGIVGINIEDHLLHDLASVADCGTLDWSMMCLCAP